jgi:hypothetical protein
MKKKYPIVQFSDDIQDVCCCYVLPVSEGSDLSVYSPATEADYFVSDITGNRISEVYFSKMNVIDLVYINLSNILAVGDCFRIVSGGLFSTIFKYIGCHTENTCVFEYWDKEDGYHQKIRLSCMIDEPQSKTEKSEYTDSNGKIISLSKTRRKELNLTTDFYPEYIHDAIKEIFLYPNLLVDDIPVYESGDYEVEWEDKDENNNAKATTKLSEQDISRYSVCQ